MTLLALKNISLRFGGPALLDGVNFAIERGERVCLLGRNGEGKSTLMRIVTGQQHADDGDVMRSPGLRIAEMPQDVPKGLYGPVREVIASGAGKVGSALAAIGRAQWRDRVCPDGETLVVAVSCKKQ